MGDVWSALTEGVRPNARVADGWLTGLGLNRAAPVEVLVGLFDAGETGFLFRADLPAGVLDAAVAHPSRNVRGRAAESGKLSRGQWDRLLAATAGLPHHGLLAEMAEEQDDNRLRGAHVGVDRAPSPSPARPTHRPRSPPWPTRPRYRGESPQLRPVVGRGPVRRPGRHAATRLVRQAVDPPQRGPRRAPSPDVVESPAHDEDRVVRLFLTESCDDAPADLLLDVWTWWPGSFSFPGRPRNHPNFPRDGLLRFADDPEPRLRLLALDDPASDADLVERFSRDPDGEVRRRAAEDPRLSPRPRSGRPTTTSQGFAPRPGGTRPCPRRPWRRCSSTNAVPWTPPRIPPSPSPSCTA